MPLTPQQRDALDELERIEAAIDAATDKLYDETRAAVANGDLARADALADEEIRLLRALMRVQQAILAIRRGASLTPAISRFDELRKRAERVKRNLVGFANVLDGARELIEIARTIGRIVAL
ncbi:MAG: hypothetical protein AAGI09_09085 [Pseudomonadota bacterium]